MNKEEINKENNKNIVSLDEFNSYIDATEEDEYMWGDNNE